MTRHTAQELSEMVNDRIREVVDSYWPGRKIVKERGVDVALLTPKLKNKRHTSSFKVEISGQHQGRWYRFSRHVGGYGLDLLFYQRNDRVPDGKADWAEAFRLAREFLGIEEPREESRRDREDREAREVAQREERERRAAADAAAEQARAAARTETAQSIWAECIPLQGTLGDAYIQARGLPPVAEWGWVPDDTMRFHPGLVSGLNRSAGAFPAIVSKVVDAWGEHVAIWREFLDRREPKKAPLAENKLGLGPAIGGAVRIGGDAEDIGGAEGTLSALGAYFLENRRRPVWAMLSTAGMAGFEPPIFVKNLRLYTDCDPGIIEKRSGRILDPPGFVAGNALCGRAKSMGLGCVIQPGHVHGDPLNLWITRKKYEARTS